MNNQYSAKPYSSSGPSVGNWFILARSGVFGSQGRVMAAKLAAQNPDYSAELPKVTDAPLPDYMAEIRKERNTNPNQDNPLERRTNSSGQKYSGRGYNSYKYQNAAYADKSRKSTTLVYLSGESFRMAADAWKKVRAVYQNSGNNENPSIQSYDPFRNNAQHGRVLPFPARESGVKYSPPKQVKSVDDTVEDVA